MWSKLGYKDKTLINSINSTLINKDTTKKITLKVFDGQPSCSKTLGTVYENICDYDFANIIQAGVPDIIGIRESYFSLRKLCSNQK